jgi:hypothetical protein
LGSRGIGSVFCGGEERHQEPEASFILSILCRVWAETFSGEIRRDERRDPMGPRRGHVESENVTPSIVTKRVEQLWLVFNVNFVSYKSAP